MDTAENEKKGVYAKIKFAVKKGQFLK